MSETFLIGSILAMVGGFLDAYTYVGRGGVLANAQTGNIVLFGINLAKGSLAGCLHYLIPIIAFTLGIITAELIHKRLSYSTIHWRQMIIAFEIIVLLIVFFLPEQQNILANVLISFVCSLQLQSFKKINGVSFATTMCTGNLRSATESIFAYVSTKNKHDLYNGLQYYAIIISFILGAIIGALIFGILSFKSIFFACGLLGVVFVLMFKRYPKKKLKY